MKTSRGFTLIEIMLVLAVMAVLASITIFAFGNWRESVANNEMKNELTTIATSLRNYRNFNNTYPGTAGGPTVAPTTLGLGYTAGQNVVSEYRLRADGNSYCIKATSTVIPALSAWYLDSATDGAPSHTACS